MASAAGANVIKVLHVLEATEGGTRRHLRDLVGALDPAEFEIVLAVSCGRGPDFRSDMAGYASQGLTVCEVAMRRGVAPAADLASLVRLIRCVRRVRPDLLHAHSAKAGFLSRLAGLVCRVPVVYTPHGFPFLMECGARARRCYRFLERCVRGATAALVAVSEEERREALALGYAYERVHLIPNGVAACAGREAAVRDGGALRVGFFGRLTRQKGPDLLLDAAADVVSHVPQTRFLFYGDGEMAEALRMQRAQRQLTSHVQFGGAYAQGEVLSLMRQTDVVAVPSRWEGCPYVVLEALQAGVPVVAASVGGIPDLLQHNVNGICVAAGDAEALSDGLLGLLRDPQKRRQLAEQGCETVAAHTLEAMAKAVGEVYRAACAGRT